MFLGTSLLGGGWGIRRKNVDKYKTSCMSDIYKQNTIESVQRDDWMEKVIQGAKVRIKIGSEIKAGGAELLPNEQPYHFGDIEKSIKDDNKELTTYQLVYKILNSTQANLPVAVEVGAAGEANGEPHYYVESPMVHEQLKGKIDHIIDVGLADLRIAESIGDIAIQSPVEEMSKFFIVGHRVNFIYLGQVLTSDGKAADVGTREKRVHILKELNRSLMPDGVVVIWNQDDNFSSDEFEECGFDKIEVGSQIGAIHLLQKKAGAEGDKPMR